MARYTAAKAPVEFTRIGHRKAWKCESLVIYLPCDKKTFRVASYTHRDGQGADVTSKRFLSFATAKKFAEGLLSKMEG